MKKIIATLITMTISFIVFGFLLGEAAVYYEMWSTDTIVRENLKNDFGLVALGIFVVLPVSVFISAILGIVVWKKL